MIQNDSPVIVYTIDISDLQAELPLFGACTEVVTSEEDNIVTLVDPNTLAPPEPPKDQLITPELSQDQLTPPESYQDQLSHFEFNQDQLEPFESCQDQLAPSETYEEQLAPIEPCQDQIVVEPAEEALSQAEDVGDAAEMYNTMEMLVDSDLADAVEEAAQLGSMTPLIKKEILLTIQHKRLKNGQDELDLKELRKRPAPVHEEVTPEGEERKKRRRDRNKVAAQRCRTRKKERAEQLEEETSELLGKQEKLNEEIDRLKQEKANLLSMLRFHDASQASKCGRKLSQSGDTK